MPALEVCVKTRARLEIWKFGGAALADVGAVRRALGLIRGHRGPLIIVASALSGITDLLLDGARKAATGAADGGAEAAERLLQRHRRVILALLPAGREQRRLLALAEQAAQEYAEITHAVAALRDLTARVSDMLVARGERLSSTILASALAHARARTHWVDATEVIVTDGRHGSASPDFAATRLRARRRLLPLLKRGLTPVVPGFIGTAPDGSVASLGRGGTDLTATLLARALGAPRVVLWKDVPGILTADPRTVGDARLIPQLHHREAAEVAYYGAKVLHPRALIPIDGTRIVLDVRSFLTPERPGTEVSGRRTLTRYPVKAVASVGGQALVTVAGKGMMGVPGIAARTFAAVQAEGLSVSTIFQASSESSIGFTLPQTDAALAVAALQRTFAVELSAGLIDSVSWRGGLAVLAVVGEGMAGTPGIAARVFSALAASGINVIAIAQGSSERNISLVVSYEQAPDAQRRIHSVFKLAKIGGGRAEAEDWTDVVLLGFGKVGRALAEQIGAQSARLRVRVVGLLDRSGYVFAPEGVSRRRLARLAQGKDAGELLAKLGGKPAAAADALTFIASHAVSRPVLVDVTAEETGDLLRSALGHGFDLVLANKKPLAGSADSYERLHALAAQHERRLRFEATVGAGLPIMDTYQKLVESGDRVRRIEGMLSGTLGYVLSAVGEGQPFSVALREAMARGYTEPDPREDLSGRDAGRKGLILARLLGYRGAPPEPENLVPKALQRLPLERFMAQIEGVDAEWSRRCAAAAARGRVLRYLVTATPLGVRVRLQAVPRLSPAGALSGTGNLVSFTTRRYSAEPLVVIGPGAGVQVTAAGILNDIQGLAATSR
jgi:bifunctional aspartokinase / homoserine dehydrogenase 1